MGHFNNAKFKLGDMVTLTSIILKNDGRVCKVIARILTASDTYQYIVAYNGCGFGTRESILKLPSIVAEALPEINTLEAYFVNESNMILVNKTGNSLAGDIDEERGGLSFL